MWIIRPWKRKNRLSPVSSPKAKAEPNLPAKGGVVKIVLPTKMLKSSQHWVKMGRTQQNSRKQYKSDQNNK
jgi:hypothetical protein